MELESGVMANLVASFDTSGLYVCDLTIHGSEQPGEVPYAHVNSVTAQMKIWSILRTEVGLSYLILDHPVVHIILYPGGGTNQPGP